jgi:hypothetical protein
LAKTGSVTTSRHYHVDKRGQAGKKNEAEPAKLHKVPEMFPNTTTRCHEQAQLLKHVCSLDLHSLGSTLTKGMRIYHH